MTFRTLIRKRRIEKGYTIKQLASKVNISDTYLSRLESGERFNPSITVVLDLCKHLDIDYATMLKTYGHSLESSVDENNISFFSEVNPELFTIDNAIKMLERMKALQKKYFVCGPFVIAISFIETRVIPLLQEGFTKMGYEHSHLCEGTILGGQTHSLNDILDIFVQDDIFEKKTVDKFREKN